ncbi:MAG: MBL fold metallo-hydrolase [Desulfofustis sp.]|jgi:phosphoribosyl 1,2-cyclic phosphodiesterase|nr:MBL fold metallo-hydrolase [Desulfofustis sp.]
MRFSVLGSGSGGNCVYIESNNTALLVDSGFSGRETAARLALIGRSVESLAAVFITHEHQDHISGAGVLSRRCRIPLFANERTYQGAGKTLAKPFRRDEFQTGEAICFRNLEIRSFAISHDAGDPVGFIVDDGVHRIGICTDTGAVSRLIRRRLSDCQALILEFNHDPLLLKNGPYPVALQQRVRSSRGHLSNGEGAELLAALDHEGLQQVVLAHLSETNNLPELAYREAAAVLQSTGRSGILDCACQTIPTRLFELT